MIRSPDPFGRKAFLLSVLLHVSVLVAGVYVAREPRQPVAFLSYEIELVSPPPAVRAEEPEQATEELVVERPEPEPEPPAEEEPEEVVPLEKPEPEPEPEPQPEPAPERPPEPAEEETPAATPDAPPDEEREISGEDINVRMEGLRRDYPVYYNNIIRQVQRCFRWREGGDWETTVFFVIRRDGTATDIDFLSRSGNAAFDFEAMGAVDCAGNGRFGPLPDELPYDRLPVQFDFRPSGSDAPALGQLGFRWDGGLTLFFPQTAPPAEMTSPR